MSTKKKQKPKAAAQKDLDVGMQAILSDISLSVEDRAAAAGRALLQSGLPVTICRAALDWLIAQKDPAAAAVLAGSLSSHGVQAAVEAEPEMLDRLLPAAAAAAAAGAGVGGAAGAAGAAGADGGDGVPGDHTSAVGTGGTGAGPGGAICGGVSALNLSSFPAVSLIGPAAAAAGRTLSPSASSPDSPDSPDSSDSSDSSDSPDSPDTAASPAAAAAGRSLPSSADSPAAGPLFRRLCERLSSVTAPTESLRAAYLAELLIPCLRLAAARPEFSAVIRGPFESIALGAEGLSALTAAAAAAAAAASAATAASVTGAVKGGRQTETGLASQLLNALHNLSDTEPELGAEFLTLLAGSLLREKTPLQGVTLLANCVGIPARTSDKTPGGVSEEADLPVDTQLLLLGRLARAIREARLPLTSAAGGQTLLQWLRAAAAVAVAAASTDVEAVAASWYDCAAELMRVSPLVLPLQGRLGPVLVQAITDCHGRDADTAAAASRLVHLTITTYSELRQLPRLLPQLLLSARQLQQQQQLKLSLTAELETLLAGQLARLPQPHVPDVWKTLLYHLGEDGVAAMKRGDEPTGSISPVLELTLQMVTCFLNNVAVIDQTTTTAAARALLPALMTQTLQTLQQMAALVTRTYQSAGHVSGLLSACLGWRRLHSALLHYSAGYRADMTSQTDGVTSQTDGVTSPLAPLDEKRWGKLARLPAAVEEPECSQLMTEFLSEAARVAPPDWQPPSAPSAGAGADPARPPGRPVSGATLAALSPAQLGRLLPSGAECRPLPLAVSVLLADRVAALPSVGGKRKRDCGRSPQELAAALRDAAAAALREDDFSLLSPPPLSEEMCGILEDVGACLESAAGRAESSERASESSERGAESLTRPLQLVLALPLEHLSEPAASLLLPLVCLCLIQTPAAGRGRRLALSALTALLVSAGCGRPLERIQPGRLLTWLASAPPTPPAALSAAAGADGHNGTPLENGLKSEDDQTSLDLSGSLTKLDHHSTSPKSPFTSAMSPSDGDGVVSKDGGCAVAAARRAVLRCYTGRRAAQLGSVADQLVSQLQQEEAGQGALDALVELLGHFVQTNIALKGSDPAVKQQAKSVSTSLLRLLSDLPSAGRRRTLAALALLVPLRAHKPIGSGKPPRWRRLLAEVFPGALTAARATQTEREEDKGTEKEERRESGTQGEEQRERAAAWELLAAVCAAREHLKSDLPPAYVMDVWRCARASDVTPDHLRTALTAADDAEIEQIVTELTEDTMSLPVSAAGAGRWRSLLAEWRALAGCSQLTDVGRAQQRRGLTRLLSRLASSLPLLDGRLDAQQLLLPAMSAVTAVVAQKHLRLSDTAYTDSLQCCHLDLSSVTTGASCDVLQAVCELLYQLVASHPAVVSNRLPLMTQAVQSVAEEVCLRSAQERQPSPEEQAALVATANRLTRVVRELVQLGPLLEPLAPYLIADLLTLLQRAPLDAEVQEAITASLYCLLTQCRDEVVTRLRVTLPSTITHLFHTTFNTYKKFYKFVGRV